MLAPQQTIVLSTQYYQRGYDNFRSLVQYSQSHLRGKMHLSPPWLRAYATAADRHVAGGGDADRVNI